MTVVRDPPLSEEFTWPIPVERRMFEILIGITERMRGGSESHDRLARLREFENRRELLVRERSEPCGHHEHVRGRQDLGAGNVLQRVGVDSPFLVEAV